MDRTRGTMTFIKKIFEKKMDDDVHRQFTRFSKGTFEQRALTDIAIGKDSIKVKMSYDLVNDTIRLIAVIWVNFFQIHSGVNFG